MSGNGDARPRRELRCFCPCRHYLRRRAVGSGPGAAGVRSCSDARPGRGTMVYCPAWAKHAKEADDA